MANTKSAQKRIRQTESRRLRNRWFRGRARRAVTEARAALEAGEVEAAKVETLEAIQALDRAAGKGVLHPNNAARRKSRLMKKLAALEK